MTVSQTKQELDDQTIDNVVIFNLADSTRASALADELRRDPSVRQAVVVERTADGKLRVPDEDSPGLAGSTLAGGVIGGLIGVLGGPLGMLLGWTVGAASGSLVDLADADDDEDGLAILARQIDAGQTVVMAEVVGSDFPANERAQAWQATVASIPASEIDAEVKNAQDAEKAAEKAARQERRQQKHDNMSAHMHNLFHSKKS